MSSSKDLIPLQRGNIPIAQMRTVYRPGDVEKRLDKLPPFRSLASALLAAEPTKSCKENKTQTLLPRHALPFFPNAFYPFFPLLTWLLRWAQHPAMRTRL